MTADKECRVLVASDGSAQATAAVETVARFPWPARTRIRVVIAQPYPREVRGVLSRAVLEQRANLFTTAACGVLSRRWPQVDVTVTHASAVAGILREAKRFDADVIVLGWRGHGAVRRLLMGSVSRGVVRGATCATLVVRGRPRDVRRIVIGVDGSPHAQRAVAMVGRLQPPRAGVVTLFTAVDQMGVPSHALIGGGVRTAVAAEVRRINAERVAQAKHALAVAAETLRYAGWRVRTVVAAGAPLRGLLEAADAANADLLVLGARGVNGVQRLLLGSVAEGALGRCRVPVVVVR